MKSFDEVSRECVRDHTMTRYYLHRRELLFRLSQFSSQFLERLKLSKNSENLRIFRKFFAHNRPVISFHFGWTPSTYLSKIHI